MNHELISFSFNLWTEPWIDLETPEGIIERMGIGQTLAQAHNFLGIYSHSPLEVVGIHRLLTAILQAALNPHSMEDLHFLSQSGCFPSEVLHNFQNCYQSRFDLFSASQPFLQSGDLALHPQKGDKGKTAAYLFPEIPSGTNVIHFQHNFETDQVFCPVCCARGLAVIPAFATTGGAGIKPSINGVPPIYILPGGKNLFESLLTSLMLPDFQPTVRDTKQDLAWWKHPPLVQKSSEIPSVGYLHSLTFPARRVRLHPQGGQILCSRCGQSSQTGIKSMVFEMGESRPKQSAFWQDPFVAYLKRPDGPPLPVRPSPGKALWREYGSLFLKMPIETNGRQKRSPIRPLVVEQETLLQDFGFGSSDGLLPFRCIGLRTDMKAKLFEWIDTGFDVPFTLLQNSAAGLDVEDAIEFSAACIRIIANSFNKYVNEGKKKGTRYAHAKTTMVDTCWSDLALPFKEFVLNLSEVYNLGAKCDAQLRKQVLIDWYHVVISCTLSNLDVVLNRIGSNGKSLRIRYETMNEATKFLYGQQKKKEEGLNE